MKRHDPLRTDMRPIELKALSLLFAMTDDEAERLRMSLMELAATKTAGGARARMFCGTLRHSHSPYSPPTPPHGETHQKGA